jgi:predicted amidophosphoribosyltransferase
MSWSTLADDMATLIKKNTAIDTLPDGRCPKCEYHIRKEENYCPNCGQRLKWSEKK